MLENIFRNMQPVVKNLLIINVLFFLATWVFEQQGISLGYYLGLKYFDSTDFQPYQLVTHFFMHDGFMHILLNMFALVVFGNMLERIWGQKKFLFFYFSCAIGASLFYSSIQAIESYNYAGTVFPYSDGFIEIRGGALYLLKGSEANFFHLADAVYANSVGASGATYGLMMGVAMLFPNREVYLYGAIPVKMKWLALGAAVIALILGLRPAEAVDGSSVAHFAHLGGMLFAFILIKIWQKDRSQFY